MRAGNVGVHQAQKDMIAASTDPNLKPSKFSSALEANASSITKYDNENRVTQSIGLTNQIREAAQVKAEKQPAIETAKVQVLTI